MCLIDYILMTKPHQAGAGKLGQKIKDAKLGDKARALGKKLAEGAKNTVGKIKDGISKLKKK